MPGIGARANAVDVWTQFCCRYDVLEGSVPLFTADASGVVAHRMVGRGDTARPVLTRSEKMEALVRSEVAKLVDDWHSGSKRYGGLIYCMGWRQASLFMPLYIGKAETLGRGAGNLSANVRNLATDRSKFARWGDNYAYHIGDLSACVLPGHRADKRTGKYEAWAKTLFVNAPSPKPKLKCPVYFWATAWEDSATGIWVDLGPTSLAFLEYLMIGVAGLVSTALLNREGIQRGRAGTVAVRLSDPDSIIHTV